MWGHRTRSSTLPPWPASGQLQRRAVLSRQWYRLLVYMAAADEDAMLAEVSAGFEEIAANPEAFSIYRAESKGLELGFEAPAPEW